jgi:two-component system sensor histidine kinase AlgZ
MHPILSERKIFLLYLTVWAVAGGFLAVLLSTTGMTVGGATVVAVPMMLIYSFMCLASYYLCRTFPLSRTNIVRLLVVHTISAALTSALWISLGQSWISLIGEVPFLASASTGYELQLPLLFAVGVVMFLLSVAVNYSVIAFRESRDSERQAMELRFLAQEAELRALRAQINPHFLFNSLNSISALTTHNPEQARSMTLGLAEFLRRSLAVGSRQRIPLREELDLIKAFLSIEKVRFGPRLRFEQSIDDAAFDSLVPPLLLQPLIENAVSHGIGHLVEGGEIFLRAERRGDHLAIVVRNPVDPDRPSASGHGIGLQNVRNRVTTLYGFEAWLEVNPSPNQFEIVLHLPVSAFLETQRPAMQFS